MIVQGANPHRLHGTPKKNKKKHEKNTKNTTKGSDIGHVKGGGSELASMVIALRSGVGSRGGCMVKKEDS